MEEYGISNIDWGMELDNGGSEWKRGDRKEVFFCFFTPFIFGKSSLIKPLLGLALRAKMG